VWLSGLGPLVRVDAVRRIVGGVATDAASKTWEWRLDDFAYPFRAVRGSLRATGGATWQGGDWQSIFRSPRMVTPDGSCQIYLSPFSNRHGSAGWPRMAVLGDSLLSSLNDLRYNSEHAQGYVEGVFNSHHVLAEVEGQSGRRWTPWGTGLDRADSYLLDEFRGLVAHGVNGVVAALGANDAGHMAFRLPAGELAAVRTTVHSQLKEVLTEMAVSSDCVVAVTTVAHPVWMLGVYSDDKYPREARAINTIVRDRAAEDPSDALRVYDFAAQAKLHQFGSAAPWFINDNLHLNPAGKLVYTNAMWLAANQCGL
jgi:lysophospholipase L1-like esterase